MRASRPPRLAAPVADAGFTRLKSHLIARTGHFYYQDKDDLLWERLQKRMAALKLTTTSDYLSRLEHPDLGLAEWAALESEITVGETYFFRYAEQFEALRQTILPDLIARRGEARRLRIWSAGCANGSEAYSVAIVLDALLGDTARDWRISILGTDLDRHALEAARAGVYGAWALRTLSDDQRVQWFEEFGPREWRLKRRHRARVRFEPGNLLDLLGDQPPLELTEFDLILCRNVLIYFHPDLVMQLVAALSERLSPIGWLLLGHAESNPSFAEMLHMEALPGAVAYRRGEGPLRPAPIGKEPARPPPPRAPIWTPPLPVATRAPERPPAPFPAPTQPKTSAANGVKDLVDQIRTRANLGDLPGAAALCDHALALAPDSSAIYFYLGLIAQEQGRPDEASRALRRALYLDPDFLMARYHLGLALLAEGKTEAGRRTIVATSRQIGTRAPSERLPEGAGLTAGELSEIARLRLSSLGGL
jgi:chemotaxis protein methyltransferase CheR